MSASGFGVRVGMFPLVLTVLNRDYDRGVLYSPLRVVSIRGTSQDVFFSFFLGGGGGGAVGGLGV